MKHSARSQSGLTLIELMIAMVMGLFLLAGVLAVFVSSKQAYRTNDALARVQESGRFALEFLSRDIRNAGLSGCARTDRIANTLNNPGSWWSNFEQGAIVGYAGDDDTFPARTGFGTNPADRIAGTDAFLIRGGSSTFFSIVQHNPSAASFQLNALNQIAPGSIVMVCDNRQASIFQVTNANASNVTMVHNTGQATPGNCTQRLGFPAPAWPGGCGPQAGTLYSYGPDSSLVEFTAAAYYIGASSQGGGRSLYRVRLNGGAPAAPQELVEGIQDMRIVYGRDANGDRQVDGGTYVAPATIPANRWNEVVSVRLNLLAISAEERVTPAAQTIAFAGANVAIPNNRLAQVFTSTVGLRNNLP